LPSKRPRNYSPLIGPGKKRSDFPRRRWPRRRRGDTACTGRVGKVCASRAENRLQRTGSALFFQDADMVRTLNHESAQNVY
jgi:hypothetical protein